MYPKLSSHILLTIVFFCFFPSIIYRFLKQDPCNGTWQEVDEVVAREKASQCLRDIVASRAKVSTSVFYKNDVPNSNNRVAKRSSAPEMSSMTLHTSEPFSKRLKNATSNEYGANACFPIMNMMNHSNTPIVKQDGTRSMIPSHKSVPRNFRKTAFRNDGGPYQTMNNSTFGINPLLNHDCNHDKCTTMFPNNSLYEHTVTSTHFLSNHSNREELQPIDFDLNETGEDGVSSSNSNFCYSSLSQFLLMQNRMN